MREGHGIRHFALRLRFLGAVAIGGYSPVPEELDLVHAHDGDGRPLIPATALRGALREGLEAVVRGAGLRACRGGDGVDPRTQPRATGGAAAGPEIEARACTLGDDGGPCLPCRLFGTRGPTVGSPFGALVIGDALPVGEAPTWTITHGVTIDRSRRSAREGLLFNRKTPAPDPELEFVAEGRLTGGDDRVGDIRLADAFEAAIAATCHIGSNLSRGLGRVDIALVDAEAPDGPAVDGGDADRWIAVTLRRPASIGVPVVEENVRRTRLDVPGSTLRGAVGWAIAEAIDAAGGEPDHDGAFQALVAERGAGGGGAIFDFLYPCDGIPPDGIAGPWPATRRRCKVAEDHPHADVLFDRLAVDAAQTAAEARRVLERAARTCAVCDSPLEPVRGWRGQSAPVPTRLVTRVSLDGRRRSARQGLLFSSELIDAGVRFVGSIRAVPDGSGARLAEGLSAPLSLGRGRSMGWGRIDVELIEPPTRPGLDARRAAFGEKLAAHLAAVGLSGRLPVERLVVFTLRAPLLPSGAGDEADVDAVLAPLGGGRVRAKIRRFGLEDGWDQRHGPRTRCQSVLAGAVYVVEADGDWASVRPRVERMEREGIGEGRCRGFGRVIAFDPALSDVSSPDSRSE